MQEKQEKRPAYIFDYFFLPVYGSYVELAEYNIPVVAQGNTSTRRMSSDWQNMFAPSFSTESNGEEADSDVL